MKGESGEYKGDNKERIRELLITVLPAEALMIE